MTGAAFSWKRDRSGSPKVAAVNEAFVRRYSAGANPLGKRLAFRRGNPKLDVEIVGVVKDIRPKTLRDDVKPLVYTPFAQEEELPTLTFYLRTSMREEGLGANVRRVVSGLDPGLPVYDMRTISEAKDRALSLEGTIATLSAAFAALATGLAGIGLYGLLAYGVGQRTREIGLRVALGAERRDVIWLVMKQALGYVAAGLAIGAPAALGLGRYLGSQLFGLKPHDPWVLAGTILVLSSAALAAAALPSRRAAKVEPMNALRYE